MEYVRFNAAFIFAVCIFQIDQVEGDHVDDLLNRFQADTAGTGRLDPKVKKAFSKAFRDFPELMAGFQTIVNRCGPIPYPNQWLRACIYLSDVSADLGRGMVNVLGNTLHQFLLIAANHRSVEISNPTEAGQFEVTSSDPSLIIDEMPTATTTPLSAWSSVRRYCQKLYQETITAGTFINVKGCKAMQIPPMTITPSSSGGSNNV